MLTSERIKKPFEIDTFANIAPFLEVSFLVSKSENEISLLYELCNKL